MPEPETTIVTLEVDFSHQSLIEVYPELDTSIADLRDEIEAMLRCANVAIVNSPESARSATDDLALIRGLTRTLETRRNDWLKPLREHTESINNVFKGLSAPLGNADSLLSSKIGEYQKKCRKAEQDARDLAELELQAQAKRDSLTEQTGEIFAPKEVVTIPIPVDAKRINSISATATATDNWQYEIVDVKLIPREYMIPNTTLLNKLIKGKNGLRTIPGLKIFNDPGLRVTTRK